MVNFEEYAGGDIGKPRLSPGDEILLKSLSDDEIVGLSTGREWEMSGVAFVCDSPVEKTVIDVKKYFNLI